MIAGFGRHGGRGARACDACRSAPSAVYCQADAVFLCGGCDARVHTANRVASRHERVWVCEGCTVAPAALACRADDAALCEACDAEVHSANPLARRHHRVPILSLPFAGTPFLSPTEENHLHVLEDEAESWLLINTNNCDNPAALFGVGQVDEYLDLVGYNMNACNEIHNQEQQQLHHHHLSEGVVPSPLCLQTVKEQHELQNQQLEEGYGLELEYEVSNCIAGFTRSDDSLSHSVSFASMDASIVPDATITDISNSHRFANSRGPIKLLPCSPLPQMAPPQFLMYREAKVLKYREKRKARKFEKIVRYASRKAYAEMRPRIKGRFVKRLDAEHKPSDGSYGIVPSF